MLWSAISIFTFFLLPVSCHPYLDSNERNLLSYFTSQNTEANTEAMEPTVMGVYVIQKEGAEPGDDPEDIGVLIEGVEVLTGLGSIAIACALLFGLIYCLNLSYPLELKCTFYLMDNCYKGSCTHWFSKNVEQSYSNMNTH